MRHTSFLIEIDSRCILKEVCHALVIRAMRVLSVVTAILTTQEIRWLQSGVVVPRDAHRFQQRRQHLRQWARRELRLQARHCGVGVVSSPRSSSYKPSRTSAVPGLLRNQGEKRPSQLTTPPSLPLPCSTWTRSLALVCAQLLCFLFIENSVGPHGVCAPNVTFETRAAGVAVRIQTHHSHKTDTAPCVPSVTVVVSVASACSFLHFVLLSLCVVRHTRGMGALVSWVLPILLFSCSLDLGAWSPKGRGEGETYPHRRKREGEGEEGRTANLNVTNNRTCKLQTKKNVNFATLHVKTTN